MSARLLRVASDEKLVAAVRQGSQPAFEVIYDRHHRGILSFCRHMLGSREEAEDALQHTYMAAYKALLGSDKDIQLKAWLYTIARNRCLSVLRARREQPSDDIEIASADGLAAEVQRRVELQDMLRDLAELPEDQREALVLSEIGDLGHDEIGDVLGVPKDKVKALVFQARSSLQQSREARDTSCEEIREMLATLSGGALRRTTLRRHVKECAGCQAFEADVKRQRRAMAAVLPVIPTVGLKDSALAAAFGQTATGGAIVAGGAAAASGSILGGGASALVAKVLVVTAVAGGGAAGVSAVSDGGGAGGPRSTPAAESSTSASGGGGGAAPGLAPSATAAAEEKAEETEAKAAEDKPRKDREARERGQDERGRALAESRGNGKKHGLRGTQPGRQKQVKEKAREKAEKRRAREKSAEQRASGRAKAKAKAKAEQQRPAKPPANPPRQEKPKDESAQRPEPTPEPEPEPTPSPTITPEITPSDPGRARGRSS